MAEYVAAQASVLLVPSTKGFIEDLKAKLEPELEKYRPEVVIKPILDKKALADIAAEIESVKSLGKDKSNVRLGVTLDKRSLAETSAEIEALQKSLGAKSVKINIKTDDIDNARKKVRSFDDELSGLSHQAAKGVLLRVAFLGLPAALAGILSLNTSLVELSRVATLLPGALASGVSVFATVATGAVGIKDAITAAGKAQDTAAESARKLADANRSVSDAQRDLNRAYKDAKRNLEDLYDQMRDAPLDEAEARLRLDEARTTESVKFGKTQLERQKDTIARMKAENDLANAQQKNTRIAEDFNEAQTKGVAGSDQVQNATDRLTKSIETLNQTASKGTLSDEMAKLAPAGQAFVTQVEAMRGQWENLRKEVQQHLFAGLDQEVSQLSTLLPNVQTGFDKIADSLNGNVKTAISALTSQGNKGLLDQIFGNTADAQRVLSTAINPLVHAMLELSATGSNALPKLAKGFGDLAQTFDTFITKAAKDGSLDKWIDEGIQAAKDLGDTFINVGDILGDFSDIFTSAGGKGLIELLKDGTTEIKSFLTSAQGQTEVKQFFQDVLTATKAWGPILRDIPGLIVNVVQASGTIGTIVLPILRTMVSLLSAMNPQVLGIVTAFLAWKTFHPVITATTGFLDKFKSKTKETSDEVGAEGAGKGKGLRGALGGMAGFLKSTAWTIAIAAAIDGIGKLGEAHDRASDAARKQQQQLEGLKGTLDKITGNATPDTISDTSKNFGNYTLPSGKQVDLNSDARGLGINPSDAVLAAADPTQQGKKDQILADLDKKTQAKIEGSDEYKRSKSFWDAAGIDIGTLAKATNGDPSSVKRVQDALKTPVDKLPFGLDEVAKGLLHVTDKALPFTAQPDGANAPTLQTFSNIAGASSSLALGVRDTSKGIGDQARLNASSSDVASGSPGGWRLAPNSPFAAYAPDPNPRRDASGQGYITLNNPPSQFPDLFNQPGWTIGGKSTNGTVTITVPSDAAGSYLQKVPGFASGGQVWGWGSGTSDSNLAKVSNGEFISQSASVDKYGPDFYHALNSGAIDPGMLPGFADGDLVGNIPLAPFTPVVPNPPTPFGPNAITPGGPSQGGISSNPPTTIPFGPPPAPGTGLQPSPNAPLIEGTGQLPVQVGGGQSAGPGGPIVPSPGGGGLSPSVTPPPSLAGAVPPLPPPDLTSVPNLPNLGSDLGDIHSGSVAPGGGPSFAPPPAPEAAPPPGAPDVLGGLGAALNPASILQRLGQILISGVLGFFGINPQPILAMIQQITGGLGGKGDGGKGILGKLLPGDPDVQNIIQNQPSRNQAYNPNQVGQSPGASGPPGAGNVASPPGAGLTLPNGTKLGSNPASQARSLVLSGTTTDAFDAAVRGGKETNPPLYAPGLNTGGYGNSKGLPDWAVTLGAKYGLAPSTYPDGGTLHQRGYAFDFAPVAGNGDPVGSMDRFAQDIQDNFQDQTLELIHANSKTNQHWGIAGGQRVGQGSGNAAFPNYFDAAWNGHDDFGPEPHVHWATDVAPLVLPNAPGPQGLLGAIPRAGAAGIAPPGATPAAPGGFIPAAPTQDQVTHGIVSAARARGIPDNEIPGILAIGGAESNFGQTGFMGFSKQTADTGYTGGAQWANQWNPALNKFLDNYQAGGFAAAGGQGAKAQAVAALNSGNPGAFLTWLQNGVQGAVAGQGGMNNEYAGNLRKFYAQFQGLPGFASGGQFSGPGTGTSDSMLARVSNGEFISRASSVDKYGPDFYHALNSGAIDPSVLPGFAAGGQPGDDSDLKKLLQGVPDAAQANGPLPDDSAQHLQGSPDVSAQHLQGNGPLPDIAGAGDVAGQLAGPTPPDQPSVTPPITDISPDPGSTPQAGASDQPDPRATPGVAPTNQQQQHTVPWLDQAVRQGINYAGQIGSAVASAAGGAAGTFGGGAAGAAAGIAISQGAQVAADVASGVLNVISSAGVGTLTPGTTAGAYGQPLRPQQQQQQTAGPAIVNQYGDIHTASYDQFYQGQQMREAQQMQPYLTSLPS